MQVFIVSHAFHTNIKNILRIVDTRELKKVFKDDTVRWILHTEICFLRG